MQCGVFHQLPQAPNRTHAERYTEMLDLVVLADTLGFDVAWLAEIHFSGAFSLLPVPLMVAPVIAQRTRRIRKGGMLPPDEVRRAMVRFARACYAFCGAYRRALSAMVIPAYAGIQGRPVGWIPACAGMTYHIAIHIHAAKFKVHNTL
jgi:hypothetical protein